MRRVSDLLCMLNENATVVRGYIFIRSFMSNSLALLDHKDGLMNNRVCMIIICFLSNQELLSHVLPILTSLLWVSNFVLIRDLNELRKFELDSETDIA